VHGSLARAGKVRGQAQKVAKQEKKKLPPKGRAKKRLQYNRRFVNVGMCLLSDGLVKECFLSFRSRWHQSAQDICLFRILDVISLILSDISLVTAQRPE
jgi:ribosomal protein S30